MSGDYPLTEAEIDAYRRDGIVVLRQVLAPDAVARLQDLVDWSMAHPGPNALNFAAESAAGKFFGDVFVWTRNSGYRDVTVTPYLAAIAGRLMGAARVRFFFDHLLVKEPGSNAPTPWHQDAPYFPIRGRQCASIWIALDPVTRANGAVEYVRGSHRWGAYYAPQAFAGDDRYKNEALAKAPDIEANRADYDIASWEMAPGDVTVHDVLTLHGAPGNTTSASRRRGLSLRFIGDDIVYDTRPGIPPSMMASLATLAPGLALGQRYTGETFPELWRAG
jgi:ectoine hydroxylase-related dioxygenase (phytanoyl-CoA dioxygenase family)